MSNDAARTWDRQAATFDDEPDHGLRDPAVREAWRDLLTSVLPNPPATIVNLGCGTGSLSILLAETGHHVHGLDISRRMLDEGRGKASRLGVAVRLAHGDARSRRSRRPRSMSFWLGTCSGFCRIRRERWRARSTFCGPEDGWC